MNVSKNQCDHTISRGFALVPVWGVTLKDFPVGFNPTRGQTMNIVSYRLAVVDKCTKCGHSTI